MAAKKDTSIGKKYKIKVSNNPEFCGIDAGGVQFAHGEAIIDAGHMVDWFREHDGYEVSEIDSKEVNEEDGKAAD